MSYGHQKMSKRGQGKSAQDEVGNTIYGKASKLLENRMKLLCPFKVEDPVEQLWQYAMNECEWESWNALRDNPEFRESMREQGSVVIKDAARKLEIIVPLPDEAQVPYITVQFGRLPDQMQMLVYTWCVRFQSFNDEYSEIRKKIAHLCKCCNTPGQIRRTWPELLGFMPEAGKNKIFRARANSPYPPEVVRPKFEYTDDTEWKDMVMVLRDEWRPEALEWMNMIFTESLVLPVMEVAPLPRIRQR